MVIEVLDQTRQKLFHKKQAFDAYAEALGYAHVDVDRVESDFDILTKIDFTPLVPADTRSDFAFLYMRNRGVRLEYPERTPSATAKGKRMAKEIQQSLSSVEIGSFDDEMRSLRGRSWSL
jgi:hypothetical protein